MADPTAPNAASTRPIERCWDVTESHLKEAIKSRGAMAELLDKMVSVARPNEGASKILIVLARMARPSCDWIEGSLRVEISAAPHDTTAISVLEDLGGNVHERVFPRYSIPVPLSEIERSIKTAPRVIEPLVVASPKSDTKVIVLTKGKARQTVKPPSFKLAEDCLRKSLPPEVKKDLAPTPPKPKPREGSARPPAPAPAREPPKKKDEFGFSFEIPRAAKTLDFSNLMPGPSEKRGPPPVPKRPKPKTET